MERRREDPNEAAWLGQLRQRFVDIASRRVGRSDVDDVVQDAMRVVVEKGIGPGSRVGGELPAVAWCFQVLRNAIGNHYRREETRRRRLVPSTEDCDASSGWHVAEALDSSEALRLIEDALQQMRRGDPNCARYLTRLVEEAKPHEVASEEGLEPQVFYRRLYRCRQKLRELLNARGVTV